MTTYFGLLFLAVAVAGFLVTMILLAIYLGPKYASRTKQIPFECGAVPVGDTREHRFNVRFYLIAMLFILFDIEVIFLYPWAVNVLQLGWLGYTEVLSFVFVVGVGLIYVWKKGVLDWNNN
jgi:NADH-quinone oxidoreductase subunit A